MQKCPASQVPTCVCVCVSVCVCVRERERESLAGAHFNLLNSHDILSTPPLSWPVADATKPFGFFVTDAATK
jgi:hypothetical protein